MTAGYQSSLPSVYGYAAAGGAQTSPDTDLILMGNRWYDPASGRFLSRDPSGSGDNPYAYCGNNAGNNLDPLTAAAVWLFSDLQLTARRLRLFHREISLGSGAFARHNG